MAIAAATAAIVLGLIWVATGRGKVPPVPGPPMSDEVFRNVQVLKGIPVDQFMGTMGIIASSVGRGCSEWHVLDSSGDWALYAEDTPLNQATRRMLVMTKQINDRDVQVVQGGRRARPW